MSVVFPQLPVIATIFVFILFLNVFEHSVRNFNVFLTLICRFIFNFFWILLTTDADALFLKDCVTKSFPSFFFPFIAKKISPLLTSLELIIDLLKLRFDDNFLHPDISLIILSLILFDNIEFLSLMASKIIFLSEKKNFFFFQFLAYFHDPYQLLIKFLQYINSWLLPLSLWPYWKFLLSYFFLFLS